MNAPFKSRKETEKTPFLFKYKARVTVYAFIHRFCLVLCFFVSVKMWRGEWQKHTLCITGLLMERKDFVVCSIMFLTYILSYSVNKAYLFLYKVIMYFFVSMSSMLLLLSLSLL